MFILQIEIYFILTCLIQLTFHCNIPNFVANCKQYSPANFVYFYIKVIPLCGNVQNLQDYIFSCLEHFATKLHNFTKPRTEKMLFATLLTNFPNSKVYLIGNKSIKTDMKTIIKILFR